MRKVILAIFCQLIGLLAHTQFSELSLLYPNTVTAFSRTSMGLGDMDLDGDLDVVSYSNGLLTFGINNNGQFGEIQSWNIAVNTTHSYKHIRCVDIDSDGDTDVLTSRFWIENDNGNIAQVHYYVNANTELYSLKLGHLDAGTYVDIYSDYYEVNGNFVGGAVPTSLVILNPGNSSLDAVLSLPLEETASLGRNCLGDVNGDGTDEVIIRFGFPQTQKVYSLVGNSLQYLWQFSAQTEGYSFADMNGDGLDDLVFAGVNYNSNTYFAVGLNSGNQSFNFVYADQPGGGGATYSVESFGELPVLDYDGDGDLDFIGIDFNNGKKWIRNNGGVAFEFMGDVVHNGYNQSATSLLLGNLDSDPEVEMVEGFNGFAVLQQGEGGYMQSDQTIFGNLSGNDVKTIISCDINQDGER
ncbi:MAG: FG-GAP-like repeat-containing protein, partial [Flavobacteriales bacterium]